MASVAITFGVLFLLSGVIDLAVGLGGADLRQVQTRFVALGAAASALPLLAIAFLLLLGGAVVVGRLLMIRLFGVVGCLFSITVLAGVAVLVLSRSDTLAQTPPALAGAVTMSLVRSAVFGVLIAMGVGVASLAALLGSRRGAHT